MFHGALAPNMCIWAKNMTKVQLMKLQFEAERRKKLKECTVIGKLLSRS